MTQRQIVPGKGPERPKIVIVGEAPGAEEHVKGEPFVGHSGEELNRMLAECGIVRADCYVTNVIKSHPTANDITQFISEKKVAGWSEFQGRYVSNDAYNDILLLRDEIQKHEPNVVIALGDTAMWALTSKEGITRWRGSVLEGLHPNSKMFKIVPTYHPAAILRMWEWRAIALNDLRRARKEADYGNISYPDYKFVLRPNINQVLDTIAQIKESDGPLAVDIETRLGHIACVGLAWNRHHSICIPLMCVENPDGYWIPSAEKLIVQELRNLLTNPNCHVIGQNFLYDAQYFARHWGFVPNVTFDTMLAQHVLFAGQPKALHYLASMYCEYYQYWKDEGKNWDSKMPEEQLWRYNCRDAVATYEVYEAQAATLDKMKLKEVFDFQMSLFNPVLRMMMRGVKINHTLREEFAISLVEEQAKRQQYVNTATKRNLNIRSPKQLKEYFYGEIGIKEIINRKSGNVTVDDDALKRIAQREFLMKPITDRIAEMRSIGVYYSTFVQGRYDWDRRLRCSYNPAGTTTYRFNSSEDAFGFGMNLQNIPPEDRDRKEKEKRGDFILPNIRRLFIPDDDCAIIDCDLDRADLQVVVWEAEDEELRAMLRQGVDLHIENAKTLFNRTSGIGKDSPERQLAKTFVHGTNYGGSAKTMAMHCSTSLLSLTVHESDTMQKRWFGAHPGIKRWHDRVARQLYETRQVENKFGYRRYFFERIDSLLPEALAWIPQSTVACIINRALVNIDRNLPTVHLLLQVHDSLVMQAPIRELKSTNLLPIIRLNMNIAVPYPQPLTIPINVKLSEKSWGEVKKPALDNELSDYQKRLLLAA